MEPATKARRVKATVNPFLRDFASLLANTLWKLSACPRMLKNCKSARPIANQNCDGSKAVGIFSAVKWKGKIKTVRIIGNIKTP